MPLPALQLLEKKFEKQIRLFELKRGAIEKKIETHFRRFEQKNRIPLDDEMRFIRSWIEKPLSIGSVNLADGRSVKGFLVEAEGVMGARDITNYGGWRAFVAAAEKHYAPGVSDDEIKIGQTLPLSGPALIPQMDNSAVQTV